MMTNIIESINSKTEALFKLAKTVGHPDLLVEIGNLKMQLAYLKDEYAKMQNEIRELKSQRQEDIDNPLSISQCGIYFDTHKNRYCAGCYDGPTRRRVHLVYQNADDDYITYFCPVCKIEYKDKDNIGLIQSYPRKAECDPLED